MAVVKDGESDNQSVDINSYFFRCFGLHLHRIHLMPAPAHLFHHNCTRNEASFIKIHYFHSLN